MGAFVPDLFTGCKTQQGARKVRNGKRPPSLAAVWRIPDMGMKNRD
jgi:hypothetical protein